MKRSKVYVWLLLASAVLAGGVSLFASSSPDGMERVAHDLGFVDTAKDSAASSSPLADYGLSWLGEGPLASAVSGLLGVLAVAALGYLLYRWTRRPQS